jgi:hypothetical protein
MCGEKHGGNNLYFYGQIGIERGPEYERERK